MAKQQRPNAVRDMLKLTAVSRGRKDIQMWRSALQAAENVTNPRRYSLLNIYNEIVLDAHLTAELEKRFLNVIGSEYYLYNAAGEHDEELAKAFTAPWFSKFLKLAMESRFWGHSLMQINLMEIGMIDQMVLIPRAHVRPETGMFVINQSDEKGITYRGNPEYEKWLIEVGDHDDIGLLNKVVPHVLYKRFAQGAWSEFCEIFGMPVRYVKTNTKDTENLNRLDSMMVEMASASYAIIDKEEELQFLQSNNGNGDVYANLMNFCNAEISKLVNGSVIGGDTKEGSRSKEEVGLQIQDRITMGDMMWMESVINSVLIPKLIMLGYQLTGYRFEFERAKDLTSLWNITQGVLQHYEVDQQYIIDTFGIPVTGIRQLPIPAAPGVTSSASSFFD